MNPAINKTTLLSSFDPQGADSHVGGDLRLAAIAIVFWDDGQALRVCLGRRAINPLDPWSGDMAFPGGKAESNDVTLHDVAARETHEEVGLFLPREALIGRMDKMGATGQRRKPTPVWPLIYLLESEPGPFRLSEEMTAAHWVPVDNLWDRQHWMAFSFPPTRAQRYGINVANHFLWGFSLQVLIALGDVLGHSLDDIRTLETRVHLNPIAVP